MAFVGISQNLVNEVRDHIRYMRDHELSASLGQEPSRITLDVTGNERWFVQKVWENKQHLISEMPASWLHKNTAVDFHFSGPDFKLQCRSEKEVLLPPQYRSGYPDVYVHFEEGEEMPTELINDHVSRAKMRTEISERWRKVETQVREFLNNCKSLNEALKLWPDLKVYIPDEFIDRVERKAAKGEKTQSNAAAFLSTINTEEVQAAAVIARMSGANV